MTLVFYTLTDGTRIAARLSQPAASKARWLARHLGLPTIDLADIFDDFRPAVEQTIAEMDTFIDNWYALIQVRSHEKPPILGLGFGGKPRGYHAGCA